MTRVALGLKSPRMEEKYSKMFFSVVLAFCRIAINGSATIHLVDISIKPVVKIPQKVKMKITPYDM